MLSPNWPSQVSANDPPLKSDNNPKIPHWSQTTIPTLKRQSQDSSSLQNFTLNFKKDSSKQKPKNPDRKFEGLNSLLNTHVFSEKHIPSFRGAISNTVHEHRNLASSFTHEFEISRLERLEIPLNRKPRRYRDKFVHARSSILVSLLSSVPSLCYIAVSSLMTNLYTDSAEKYKKLHKNAVNRANKIWKEIW